MENTPHFWQWANTWPIALLLLTGCAQQGPVSTEHSLRHTVGAHNKAEHPLLARGEPIDEDGPPYVHRDPSNIPDAVPQHEPLSPYGNPHTYEAMGTKYRVLPNAKDYKATGMASWYGRKFHGQRTSSGEPYDMFAMTAAHKSLPLPTYAKIKNLDNGKEVVVKINDRGPFVKDRLIDLSYAAAKKLGIYDSGTGKVLIAAIDPKQWYEERPHLTPPPSLKDALHAMERKLYLQLGTFREKPNAEALAKKASILTSALAHSRVRVLEDKHTKSPFYRVRVGPLNTEQEAKSLQQTVFANSGLGSTKLVYE